MVIETPKRCPACGKSALISLLINEWVCGCSDGCGGVDDAADGADEGDLYLGICRSKVDAIRQWNQLVEFYRSATPA